MDVKLPGLGVPLRSGAGKAYLHPGSELPDAAQMPDARRWRIWELNPHFHCSIIGTCLTTTELRQILVKMQLPGANKETDHQLHGRAVLLAGKKDTASKLLQKALDRRHHSAIDRFGRARDAEELRCSWDAAVQRAEIPGAYWAALTHPQATEDLVRHVFGEVHMLSHLVGAANRADIRRLRELEAANVALQEKVARQQRQLRDAVVSRDATIAARDATIAGLNDMLANALATTIGSGAGKGAAAGAEEETAVGVISGLRHRLASEMSRREKADRRLQSVTAELQAEKKAREAIERREHRQREMVESAELALAQLLRPPEAAESPARVLDGVTLLYVGGRAHQVAQLRRLAQQWSANLLHHDGGIDDRSGLLEAQVARADLTLFPVDCVSHNAVVVIKRVARSAGKPFLALRSSGLTSFVAALRSMPQGEVPAGAAPQAPGY